MSPGAEPSLLIVDDEVANLESLERVFRREGYRVLRASSGAEALATARKRNVQVVLCDLMMPGMGGLELIEALKTVAPEAVAIVMTAYGTIETAVEAMKQGVYDFVEKPLKRVHILKSVRQATERHRLVTENRDLRRELTTLRKRDIIGSAPALRQALAMARQAAPSLANVLVLGESGTGKELLAREVHAHSARRGDFIAVNLAALPETVVEAELFGHERGAFTGAAQRREGRVGLARGGTLFLDEIGELSLAVQVKLLRLLQEGEYEPLGGTTQPADVRVVAASNRDLRQAIEEGSFREDLYYRLDVITITCPPLRHRDSDIPLLVDHFIGLYCRKNRKMRLSISDAALRRLCAYPWPGNVRELENAVERAVVLCQGTRIEESDLPEAIARTKPTQQGLHIAVGTPLDEVERRLIHSTLEHTGGDKQRAARLLGVSTRTIYRKLEESL